MAQCQKLSRVAQSYLGSYYNILDDMINGMTQAALTESISHNFIVCMIPHHKAAIHMSHNLLQYTTCIPLQDIADSIIEEQTKGIEEMQNILEHCSHFCSKEELCVYQKKYEEITHTMFSRMENAKMCNNLNTSFMYEMIPHHMGAVLMSENALRFPLCPDLIPILQTIIVSQKRGICQMEQLLRSILQHGIR